MVPVAVRILHAEAGSRSGPLTRVLADARRELAARHATAFAAAGADDVAIVAGVPDGTPFGARLRDLVARLPAGGLVVLGSGALPLATADDCSALVAAARGDRRRALANNRFSADAIAISCAGNLRDVPDLASDNALPRWLAEAAGYEVADLRRRWRLGIDLDSPLDLVLVAGGRDRRPETSIDASAVRERLADVAAAAADPRAELVVAGRTSAASLAWLERQVAARVRAIVEERGLRAADPAAVPGRRAAGASDRQPRSVLGLALDHAGPEALGTILAELGDAALVDSRVLIAHRFGRDEAGWPSAEDRFASDLLRDDDVADPWLRALTASARRAPIPVVLGGHTLVGPGIRLAVRRRTAP